MTTDVMRPYRPEPLVERLESNTAKVPHTIALRREAATRIRELERQYLEVAQERDRLRAALVCDHVWVPGGLGEVCNKCWIHSSQINAGPGE